MELLRLCRSRLSGLWLVVVWAGGTWMMPSSSLADAFQGYGLTESFTLPAGAGPFTTLADGRVLTIVDDELFVENAAGSRTFASLGVLPDADIPFFGAAFIAVSPDQTKVAVGNNGSSTFVDYSVGVFDLDTLTGDWFTANHFVAVWLDNTRLVLAASDFFAGSSVTVLDTTSPDPMNPVNTVLVGNKGGASGGVAFDADGNLLAANGFTNLGPSGTGAIKVFAEADWMAVLSGGPALDFELSDTLILDVLSGTPLVFDDEGNLIVGGGSDPPDSDFLAVVRASAVADAIDGAGPIDPNDAASVRRLDPITTSDANFYDTVFNAALHELYVRDFGDANVYVYEDLTDNPFAMRVISYDPAPGQFVNDPIFNDPDKALGMPQAGGIDVPNNDSVVSLGALGGSITLAFDHAVLDDPLNPFGMDAIVFSNAFWPGGDPEGHWAELATIEISFDANGNGCADDDWFLIPGSHLSLPGDSLLTVTWDQNVSDPTYPPDIASWIPPGMPAVWTTSAYPLPLELYSGQVIWNPGPDEEAVFGYAEYSPTLVLGDLDADNIVEDAELTPELFYTVPDDPLSVGITPGSGGGDAFDIAWAVDPATGDPAELSGFDFIRLTTAVPILSGLLGEVSAEIDAVADVARVIGDADEDDDIDLRDIAIMTNCFSEENVASSVCDFFDRQPDGVVELFDAAIVLDRMTGPGMTTQGAQP